MCLHPKNTRNLPFPLQTQTLHRTPPGRPARTATPRPHRAPEPLRAALAVPAPVQVPGTIPPSSTLKIITTTIFSATLSAPHYFLQHNLAHIPHTPLPNTGFQSLLFELNPNPAGSGPAGFYWCVCHSTGIYWARQYFRGTALTASEYNPQSRPPRKRGGARVRLVSQAGTPRSSVTAQGPAPTPPQTLQPDRKVCPPSHAGWRVSPRVQTTSQRRPPRPPAGFYPARAHPEASVGAGRGQAVPGAPVPPALPAGARSAATGSSAPAGGGLAAQTGPDRPLTGSGSAEEPAARGRRAPAAPGGRGQPALPPPPARPL